MIQNNFWANFQSLGNCVYEFHIISCHCILQQDVQMIWFAKLLVKCLIFEIIDRNDQNQHNFLENSNWNSIHGLHAYSHTHTHHAQLIQIYANIIIIAAFCVVKSIRSDGSDFVCNENIIMLHCARLIVYA